MVNRWENNRNSERLYFGGSKITADSDCSQEIKRCLLLGRKAMTNLDSILKKQRYYFADKGPSSQGYGFSSGHVWMWELDCEESWGLKNWCFWTVVLENCGEPVRHSAHDKGHEEGGSAYAKAGSSLRGPPGYSRAFSPKKPESAYFIAYAKAGSSLRYSTVFD